MAATIEQARLTISKIFNGEPRTYTRFNLAKSNDGDNSHVEVKLSAEGEDDMGTVEEASQHAPNTYTQRPRWSLKNYCYVLLGALLLLISGYLVGYVSHRKPSAPAPACVTEENVPIVPQPVLSWGDIRTLLEAKLSPGAFSSRFSEFDLKDKRAGSDGDQILGNKILKIFQDLDMNPWTDGHYVKLQVPSNDIVNKVLFGSEEIGNPKGYLAYSATGSKEGRVIYANYGRLDDFQRVKDMKKDLQGSVALLRAGQISMAEKVNNAANHGVAAVLIYRDPADYAFDSEGTEVYDHVHLGSGDPYTPGFPSFNHTQFPPAKSSGLPGILAQTITAGMAVKIFKRMGGDNAPTDFEGRLSQLSNYKLGNDSDLVTVVVNNVLTDAEIHNVFGVIKGYVDPDRYVVIGAQRDSMSSGFAKSTVGTSLLVELARAIMEMVKQDNFRPRRSLVFASWSGGDFGNIGATEWLEGYMTSLDKKAFTYISLDGPINGPGQLKATASPLLQSLLSSTLKEMNLMSKPEDKSLFKYESDWEKSVLEEMKMDDGAYPFLALSGIPSISFRFTSSGATSDYQNYGTALDTRENLDRATKEKVGVLAVYAAQVAGQMALKLVHDHLLKLDVTKYTPVITSYLLQVRRQVHALKQAGVKASSDTGFLTSDWLTAAWGSYKRAAESLRSDIENSDLEDEEMCRNINDRLMTLEHSLLSPYVSVREAQFRHVFYGYGEHTMSALVDHLNKVKKENADADMGLCHNQLALATWTIQACANALAGDVWALDNDI